MDRIYNNNKLSYFGDYAWNGDILKGRKKYSIFNPLYMERFCGIRKCEKNDMHDFWEITAINEGNLTFHADRKIYAEKNSIILIPPGIEHREYSEKDVDTFWLGFQADCSLYKDDKVLEHKSEYISKMLYNFWIFSISHHGSIGPELEGMLLRIIGSFFRESEEGSGSTNSVFENVITYMNENFHENISMEEIAEKCNLSEGYFYRQFKKFTGQSPLNYLNAIRIKKAAFYLEHTSFYINKIAEMCGFNDPYYFSRIFKKTTKSTPQQYRKKFHDNTP